MELTAAASLGAWVYLITARGGFWKIKISPKPARSGAEKTACVIIPARNEEAVVGQAIKSLRPWQVIVVDDHSSESHGRDCSRSGS